MANTLTQTTSGVIASETFESGVDEDNYSGAFSVGGTAKFDTARAFRGTKSLRIVTGNAWDAFYIGLGSSLKEICISARVYQTAGSPQVGLYIGDNALADAGKAQWLWRAFSPDVYKAWGSIVTLTKFGTFTTGQWAQTKVYSKDSGYLRGYIFNENNTIALAYKEAVGTAIPVTSDYAGLRIIFSSDKVFLDDVYIMTSDSITIAGIVPDMIVQIVDASTGQVMKSQKCLTGTSVVIDMEDLALPCLHKFRVLGTDGSEQYVSTSAEEITGGDTWTYSGATATPSGGAIINLMNNIGG